MQSFSSTGTHTVSVMASHGLASLPGRVSCASHNVLNAHIAQCMAAGAAPPAGPYETAGIAEEGREQLLQEREWDRHDSKQVRCIVLCRTMLSCILLTD